MCVIKFRVFKLPFNHENDTGAVSYKGAKKGRKVDVKFSWFDDLFFMVGPTHAISVSVASKKCIISRRPLTPIVHFFNERNPII